MVFKRDHSTVASSESPKLAAQDSDPKKLRASSRSPVHLPASPALSATGPPSSPGGDGGVPELPDFLVQDKHSVARKFKLLDAKQRDRIVHGMKNGNSSPFHIDDREQTTSRNRYTNILVWSSTRVKLGIDSVENDYINASHIELESRAAETTKRYVATQGPKQEQARHLWLMALEQTAGPGVVVMLTKPFELGREKCYEYFPLNMESPTRRFDKSSTIYHDSEEDSIEEDGDETDGSTDKKKKKEKSKSAKKSSPTVESPPPPPPEDPFVFDVNLLDFTYDEETRTEVRKIEIKVVEGIHKAEPDATGFAKELKEGDTKIVWHLLFKGWPDWNVPEGADSEALLKLIDLANKKNEAAESPLIVHCSAGVGRSGTFIALDHLLTELNRGTYDTVGGDPIFDLVDRLREQRMYMVQSEPQFEYLYRILREKLEEKLGIPPGRRFLSPSSTLGGLRTPSLKTLSRKPSLEPVSAT